jgi:hypothetical protein
MTRVKETDLKLVHEAQDKRDALLKEYSNKEKVKALTVAERLLRIERFLRIVE